MNVAKGWIGCALAILGVAAPARAALLAEWTFDESSGTSAADSSVGSHTATLHGFSGTPWVAGVSGNGLQFDGIDDFVDVGLDVSESTHTVAFWFKTTAATTGMFSVSAGDRGATGHDRHVYLTGGQIGARTWNGEVITSTNTTGFNDGSWHLATHVFGQAGSAGQKLYIDGVEVAAGSKSQSDFNWQDSVIIGFSNDVTPNYFQGVMDDVRVWDSALTASQIQALAPEPTMFGIVGMASAAVMLRRRREA